MTMFLHTVSLFLYWSIYSNNGCTKTWCKWINYQISNVLGFFV